MFTSYEELRAAVEERREAILTLEVDLGGAYSQEHEDAKKALATAKGLRDLTKASGGAFLADNLAELEQAVIDTKPDSPMIWVQFKRIPLDDWALLIKNGGNMTATEQYEKVLPKVFIGVYGQDPLDADGKQIPGIEPLTTDARSMSSRDPKTLLPGPGLNPVVSAFMNWQNSGGDVNIRPTKSGHVSPSS